MPRRATEDQPTPVDRAQVTLGLFGPATGMFILGIAAGAGIRWIESQVAGGPLTLSLGAYQALLATLVSGLITATVFAIWMRTVVTGLMAGQASVRVLAAYLDDRFQRWVLSLMMGGVGLSAATLVALPARGPVHATISLPVLLAVLVAAVAGVLLTLNRGVRDLSVQELIYRLTHRGLHLVHQREAAMEPTEADPDVEEASAPERDVVRSVLLGWVVDIDHQRIARHLPEGSWTRLHVRPGQLRTPGAPLLTTSGDLTESDHRAIRHAVRLGRQRQLGDDLGYLVRQMVDMACAGLAPSSNDTATSDEAMMGLGVVLAELTRIGDPRRLMKIEDRWLLDEASLGVRDVTKDAIERLRVAAASTPSASRQLVETFATIAVAARDAGRDDVLGDLREQMLRLLSSLRRSELAGSDRDELRSQAIRVGLISVDDASDDPNEARTSWPERPDALATDLP